MCYSAKMALTKITPDLQALYRLASNRNRNVGLLDATFKKHPHFRSVPFSSLILSYFILQPKAPNFGYLLNHVDPTDNGEYRSLEIAARQKSNCLREMMAHPKVNLDDAFIAIKKRCPKDKVFHNNLESIFNK